MAEKIDIQYRPANQDDLDLTYKIKVKSLKPYIVQIWGWDEQMQEELHKARFNFEKVTVILLDDLEVGFYEHEMREDELRIENILIMEEFRSKGIGKRVLGSIVQVAGKNGLDVSLRVFKINVRARAFYERNGFVEIGETAHHIEMELSAVN